MSTALVIISDGRGYLSESVPSLIANADPSWFSSAVIVEDGEPTAHPTAARDLLEPWLDLAVDIIQPGRRLGGAASIQAAWSWLDHDDATHVFHLEEDFTFPAQIPLPEMLKALDVEPLANVVLRRGPDGAEGPDGYIDDTYAEVVQSLGTTPDPTFTFWMRHTNGFWLNPCVYPRAVTELGWPDHGHEHDFTDRALEAGYGFAVYGARDDPPRCTHIGDRRAAEWTW